MAELEFGKVELADKNKEKMIDMLIRFFNFQKNTKFKVSNENNRKVVAMAYERANGDVVALKNHIRSFDATNLEEVFDSFGGVIQDPYNPSVEEGVSTPAQTSEQVNNYMGLLEKAVVELVAQTNAKEIEEKVMSSVEDKVRDFIKQEYGTLERKINTVVNGVKSQLEGVQHDKFETVLKFVSNNEPVFLTGPAGSGKNVLCQQVAKALGLKFYFSNAVTQEYKITGFTDAMGVFHESQFYKAFKNGGVFMLDEIDASIPEVLVILNAALANRYFDFPAPIGYVEAHPDFRVIAAGNTFGLGADYEYVGRNQLDMASLDRFAMVKIDYSEAIELNVAMGDRELVNFARDFRQASQKSGVKVILSYRCIGRIAKMQQILPLNEVLLTCLVKGMEKDDLNMVVKEMKLANKYRTALENIVKEL